MVSSSPLTKALKFSLAVLIAVPLAMATGASAQQTKRSPHLPKPAKIKPWQKKLNKSFRPTNPRRRLERARRGLRRDYGKSIGLPAHAKIRQTTAPHSTGATPVTLDPVVSHLDIDGDGSISRNEYFQGRSRLSNLGVKTGRNKNRRSRRLASQFRRTDLNGDGRVTPEELQSRGAGRF